MWYLSMMEDMYHESIRKGLAHHDFIFLINNTITMVQDIHREADPNLKQWLVEQTICQILFPLLPFPGLLLEGEDPSMIENDTSTSPDLQTPPSQVTGDDTVAVASGSIHSEEQRAPLESVRGESSATTDIRELLPTQVGTSSSRFPTPSSPLTAPAFESLLDDSDGLTNGSVEEEDSSTWSPSPTPPSEAPPYPLFSSQPTSPKKPALVVTSDEKDICSICLFEVRDPVVLYPCGHRFDHECARVAMDAYRKSEQAHPTTDIPNFKCGLCRSVIKRMHCTWQEDGTSEGLFVSYPSLPSPLPDCRTYDIDERKTSSLGMEMSRSYGLQLQRDLAASNEGGARRQTGLDLEKLRKFRLHLNAMYDNGLL